MCNNVAYIDLYFLLWYSPKPLSPTPALFDTAVRPLTSGLLLMAWIRVSIYFKLRTGCRVIIDRMLSISYQEYHINRNLEISTINNGPKVK